MRVCIADMEAYEKEHLVSEWVDLPMSEDKLNEIIENILSKGQELCKSDFKHEQVLITDYKSIIEIEVYDNIYILNHIAKNIYDLLKFRFLIFQGFLEKDIMKKGLDFYEVEIYDFSAVDKKIDLKLEDGYTQFQKGSFWEIVRLNIESKKVHC